MPLNWTPHRAPVTVPLLRRRLPDVVPARAGARPLLFDLAADPTCSRNLWPTADGHALRDSLRACMTLSQDLLSHDRIFPADPEKVLR